jgi:hypothetical protein
MPPDSNAPAAPRAEGPIAGQRAFLQFLEKLGYGQAVADLSRELEEQLRDLHEKWTDRGDEMKASLTVQFIFEIDQHGAVASSYKVARKDAPRHRPGAIFFMNHKGALTTQNPRQPELPGIRDVSAPKDNIRDPADNDETREGAEG